MRMPSVADARHSSVAEDPLRLCVADPPPQGLFLISLLFFSLLNSLFKRVFSYLINNNE